ncbi:MAG: aldehyde dehydrogenase family protein [Acidobacteriota bacterium]|nr:aldehyde dehydrogenase family protein [Acidobacteriota bacterium]
MRHDYRNFINGNWVESFTGKTFEHVNPADRREVMGEFQESAAADVDAAVAAAAEAYPGWRLTPAPKRGEMLFRVAQEIERRKEELARQMTREMGKVITEARGDVQEAIDMTYYMAGEGRRLFGQTTPSELPNKYCMTQRVSLGVCALITPWNFPMAIPAWKSMPALIAGNTIVMKPSPESPLSMLSLVEIFERAGAPPGVVNFVTGSTAELGAALAGHKQVRAVSFTGSSAVGRDVAMRCAPEFKHVALEMGGKNVILVMDDSNLDLAVDGAIWGGFGTTGQRCTAASRVIVDRNVYGAFAARLTERARALKIGNGLDPEVQVGPVINERQLKRIEEYVQIGKQEGAKLLCGGERVTVGDCEHGWFYSPTVFGDCNAKMRIVQEEIFGPVVALIPCNGLDDAIQIGNDAAYGLSSAIYTQDVNQAFRAMREMETGIFYVNASTIGAETHLPFGGVKQTGNGHREAAIAALDFYTEWKSIYVDFSGKLQRAQIDT